MQDALGGDAAHTYVSAGASDVGRLRTSNQDAYGEFAAAGLWVVADGMGGYSEGDVAAHMVCDALAGVDTASSLEEAVSAVRERINEVNARLYRASIRPVNPVMSGSTVVVLLARGESCAVLWAGDSRAYRLRRGGLQRLTSDHTWAGELNIQEPPQGADHAITRAVGGEYALLLDVSRKRVCAGDRYLLCSDGLTRELDDDRIAALLGRGDVRECAAALIAATLQNGARDNVTVVVVEAQRSK
ncbi:MAG: protein phosphatase 2C domain-containing protein [Steroidobacteraceae bacterium]|jgi:serine/threonine protein phosphatase PrpC|nr:protein phosphatase 2C domain-containing protein [Steroidobacteraceae bacterium]